MPEKEFDVITFLMDFECNNIVTRERMVEGFQYLIDTGMAWKLQGNYGITASKLISAGWCKAPERGVQ